MNRWTKIDRDDVSTWPSHEQTVFVTSMPDKNGIYRLGVCSAEHGRDMVSMFNPFKWEKKVFFYVKFTVGYWRPVDCYDYPDFPDLTSDPE